MDNKKSLLFFLIFFLSINVVEAIGESGISGTYKKLPVIENYGGDFKLTGPDRNEISSFNFRGKVLLINFGYTYCPDVCPMTLTHLKKVMIDLDTISKNVQVFFISIDPERDTPEKLKEYVPYFYSTFIGLTGSVKDVTAVAKKYGIHFFKQKVESELNYLLAHMEGVFLIDQNGFYRGRYKTDQDLDRLVTDIRWLIESDS